MHLKELLPTAGYPLFVPWSRDIAMIPIWRAHAAQGQTGMPSWVAAAGVPDPENVEPTKMPHEPGE